MNNNLRRIMFALMLLISSSLLIVNCMGYVSPSDVSEVKVKPGGLNVRKGPGTEYGVIGQAYKEDILKVAGEEKGWYLVCLPDGSYGMVYGGLTEPVQLGSVQDDSAQLVQGDGEEILPMTDTELLFSLTNEVRSNNNLEPFEWDEELNQIALKKCQDMIENNYFGHESPIYGTPFKMLKQLGVEYGFATENLARSSKVQTAFEQIMASPAHRGSVLSKNYNRIGVAVVEKSKYAKLVVQIFVGS